MSKHEINETVALYKQKVADRIAEVKAKMEAEFNASIDADSQTKFDKEKNDADNQ